MIEFAIMTIGGVLGGAGYLLWRRRATWLSRMEVTSIAEFPATRPAKAKGVVGLHDALTEAPLSGRRCVCFSVTVEELRGGTHIHWAARGDWSGGVPFLLSDGSGTALVEPRRGVFALTPDHDSKTTPIYPPGERERAVLDRLGLNEKNGRYFRHFRFREAIVEVGDTVVVHGPPLRSEPEPDASAVPGGYRDGSAARLTLQSNATHKVVISSLARDIEQ